MRCQVTDETYIKVKGNWTYFYRAVDKNGKTIKKYIENTNSIIQAHTCLNLYD
jgi:transposase-like protein